MSNNPWQQKEKDSNGDSTGGCFIKLLKIGGIVLLCLWLYGLIFGNTSDKKEPTPIPITAVTEKPRLNTMFYEQTSDAEYHYLYDEAKFDIADSTGCPDGCTYHKDGCDIKGNVSYNTGEKIYHLVGQEYYSETEIDPYYGERWFCTESEAKANGWRKSYK